MLKAWLVGTLVVAVLSLISGHLKERFVRYYNLARSSGAPSFETSAIVMSLFRAGLLLAFNLAVAGAVLGVPLWGIRRLLQ